MARHLPVKVESTLFQRCPSLVAKLVGSFDPKENDETRTMFVSGEKLECSICMDEFKEKDQAKLLPCCHHFHEECISRWLRLVRSDGSSLRSSLTHRWFV